MNRTAWHGSGGAVVLTVGEKGRERQETGEAKKGGEGRVEMGLWERGDWRAGGDKGLGSL